MLSLAPGWVVDSYGTYGRLRHITTGEEVELEEADLALASELALGRGSLDRPGFSQLLDRGWAAEAALKPDPAVRKRLEQLCGRYRWCGEGANQSVSYDPLLEVHATRRLFHRNFGQYAALPETVYRRAALAREGGPKRILVLGDDDFLSIALLSEGHQVVVFEIDPLVVALIEQHAQKVRGDLTVVRHDLREALPSDLDSDFDLFFCDPLSGPMALRLFISRGLAMLGASGRGFACVSEAAQLTFREIIDDLHLTVDEYRADFNHYYGPSFTLAPYVSDLVELTSPSTTRPKPTRNESTFAPGHSVEEIFSPSPATRYVFKDVDPRLAELVHLDTALDVLTRADIIKQAGRQRSYSETHHAAQLLGTEGETVTIRVNREHRIAELFVAPAHPTAEEAMVGCLLGLFGNSGAVCEKRRLRNSSYILLQ